MTNFFQNKINKEYLKYFLVLGWISILASLSFDPFKLYLFYENLDFKYITKSSLFELIDISRGLFQIFYFIILLPISLILLKTKKIFLKSNIIFLLFLLIFLIEVISLFKTDNPNINIFFTICSLNILLTLFLLKNFFSETDINLIFKLSIIFLIFLLFFFGFKYISTAFEYGNSLYSAWGIAEKVVNYQIPKPTGLSRTALIIFLVLSNINLFKRPFDKINYLIMTLSIVLLLLLSSRTSIFLYFLYVLFCIFYFKIYKPKNLIILLSKFVFIPIVVIIIIGLLQNIYYFKVINKSDIFELNPKTLSRDYPKIKTTKNTEFTSGRLNDWKDIIIKNKNFLLGNGVLGDRYLINQSASNVLIYKYASSGIIGILIFILISLIALFYAYKNIFIEKSKSTSYRFLSSLILFALMMRSILETSYGVFGIDFILFCLSFSLIIPNKNSYESK